MLCVGHVTAPTVAGQVEGGKLLLPALRRTYHLTSFALSGPTMGMSSDQFALLKEEYFHLQRTVEDFDQRALTIKSWSVTTSMAGIAAGFLQDKVLVLCLLSSLASLLFWCSLQR